MRTFVAGHFTRCCLGMYLKGRYLEIDTPQERIKYTLLILLNNQEKGCTYFLSLSSLDYLRGLSFDRNGEAEEASFS
jgi:hypothetical protein